MYGVSVDLRTRNDADVEAVDAPRFFMVDLPEAVERRPDLVELTAGVKLRPLRVEVDGRAWVLDRDDNGTPRVNPGGETPWRTVLYSPLAWRIVKTMTFAFGAGSSP